MANATRDTPYHLIVTPFFPGEDPMQPIRYIVETGSADAIIMNQTLPQDPRIAYLMEQRFPFATHGRTDWCDQHPYFDFDNAAFARIAVRELAARGRSKLLVVAPPQTQAYAEHLIKGARAAAAAAAADMDLRILASATSDDGVDAIRAAVTADLTEHGETDAILCASTTGAMSAVAALEKCGRVLTQDIDVFAKEPFPFLQMFRPGLMTVTEDVARAGSFLVSAAIQAIREPNLPPMQRLNSP